jgi:hypothetical protein
MLFPECGFLPQTAQICAMTSYLKGQTQKDLPQRGTSERGV